MWAPCGAISAVSSAPTSSNVLRCRTASAPQRRRSEGRPSNPRSAHSGQIPKHEGTPRRSRQSRDVSNARSLPTIYGKRYRHLKSGETLGGVLRTIGLPQIACGDFGWQLLGRSRHHSAERELRHTHRCTYAPRFTAATSHRRGTAACRDSPRPPKHRRQAGSRPTHSWHPRSPERAPALRSLLVAPAASSGCVI